MVYAIIFVIVNFVFVFLQGMSHELALCLSGRH